MRILAAAMVLGMLASTASAATLTVGSTTYQYGSRSTFFDQNIESESGAVTKSGVWFNYNVDGGATAWGSGTWLFTPGSYVEVAFSAVSDTLYAQLQSDTNDGIAQIWVDSSFVGSYDTYNRGWHVAEVSGLALGSHVMRIVSQRNPLGADDLAFDNFGAKNTSPAPIPLPAGAPLLLAGLAALAALVRRRHTA